MPVETALPALSHLGTTTGESVPFRQGACGCLDERHYAADPPGYRRRPRRHRAATPQATDLGAARSGRELQSARRGTGGCGAGGVRSSSLVALDVSRSPCRLSLGRLRRIARLPCTLTSVQRFCWRHGCRILPPADLAKRAEETGAVDHSGARHTRTRRDRSGSGAVLRVSLVVRIPPDNGACGRCSRSVLLLRSFWLRRWIL